MSSDEVREVSRLHQTLADAIERYHEAQATAAAAGGEIGSGSGANVQLSSDVEKTLNVRLVALLCVFFFCWGLDFGTYCIFS